MTVRAFYMGPNLAVGTRVAVIEQVDERGHCSTWCVLEQPNHNVGPATSYNNVSRQVVALGTVAGYSEPSHIVEVDQ